MRVVLIFFVCAAVVNEGFISIFATDKLLLYMTMTEKEKMLAAVV